MQDAVTKVSSDMSIPRRPASPCRQTRRAFALAIVMSFAVLFLQPVQAADCVTHESTVVVPQVRDAALRIGRLTSLTADGLPNLLEVTFHYIDTPGSGNFRLVHTGAALDSCTSQGLHTADFDITFFVDKGDGFADAIARYDTCGNEAGTVDFGADFAIVWLSAGSLPVQSFRYEACA